MTSGAAAAGGDGPGRIPRSQKATPIPDISRLRRVADETPHGLTSHIKFKVKEHTEHPPHKVAHMVAMHAGVDSSKAMPKRIFRSVSVLVLGSRAKAGVRVKVEVEFDHRATRSPNHHHPHHPHHPLHPHHPRNLTTFTILNLRHAGKFEKKHEAAGLHLWYKVKVVNHPTFSPKARAHATVDSIERLLNNSDAFSLYHSVEVGVGVSVGVSVGVDVGLGVGTGDAPATSLNMHDPFFRPLLLHPVLTSP